MTADITAPAPVAVHECWFCRHPAITVGFGFAICGGREETPINCSERARTTFMERIGEASRGAKW